MLLFQLKLDSVGKAIVSFSFFASFLHRASFKLQKNLFHEAFVSVLAVSVLRDHAIEKQAESLHGPVNIDRIG